MFCSTNSFPRSSLQTVFAQNTLIEARVLRYTEMTLHVQKKSRFSHFRLGLPLLPCPCIIVIRTHSTTEQRVNQVGEYFFLQNHYVKKQCKGGKLLFILLQVANVYLVKKRFGIFLNVICVKGSRLVGALDKRARKLNRGKDVLLRGNVDACVIKVHDVDSLRHWSIFIQLHKQKEQGLVLHYHRANCYVPYMG